MQQRVVTDMVVLCHGIDSPLPTGASKGQAISHLSIALRQQTVFAKCHVLTSIANYGFTFQVSATREVAPARSVTVCDARGRSSPVVQGIDVLGARLMAEIEDEVAKEHLRVPGRKLRFSIVGHSLGMCTS